MGSFWGCSFVTASTFPRTPFTPAAETIPACHWSHSPPAPEIPLVALDSCEIYSVPLALVERIPVVRWKLFEAFRNTHPYAAPRYRGTAR